MLKTLLDIHRQIAEMYRGNCSGCIYQETRIGCANCPTEKQVQELVTLHLAMQMEKRSKQRRPICAV